MTVIAAIKDRIGVYIGADSYGSNSSMRLTLDRKIFPLMNGQMAITGSYRGAQIIRETYPHPEKFVQGPKDMYEFTQWMKEEFISHGMPEHGEKKEFAESTFACLYATGTTIWSIQSNFAFHEHKEFYAMGAGEEYALGAFHALKDIPMPVREKLKTAIEAACFYHPYCGGEIVIEGPI